MSSRDIDAMQAEVHKLNTEKGWYDKPVGFLEAMALLHTEISEAVNQYLDEHDVDQGDLGYLASLAVDHTYISADVENYRIHGAPSAFDEDPTYEPDTTYKASSQTASELADVFIRLLDDCERFGVRLHNAFDLKMARNWTRPYRHGGKLA